MNEEIDVRPVLPTVRVPALVLYREQEYLREASRYMGERLPGARIVEVPGVDHLPWEGDQAAVLDQIELFLGGLDVAPAGPGPVLTTVLVADLPDSEAQLLDSMLSRFRGHVLEGRGEGLCAGFDGPARAVRCAAALADHLPALRAGIHTGECELRDGMLSGSALAVATYLAGTAEAGEVLTTSTVQDLVVGSGIDFDERGTLGELRLFGVRRT